MIKKITLLLFFVLMSHKAFSYEISPFPYPFVKNYKKAISPSPLFVVGGGYYNAGPKQPKNVAQLEYRFGQVYLTCFRPQAVLILPALRSFFLGIGFGIEVYATDHIVITPSFTPGFYYKGSGRDLGYPLEFRSCFEVAYEWKNKTRIGMQGYHLSNASLSKKNPGANALTFIFSIPL